MVGQPSGLAQWETWRQTFGSVFAICSPHPSDPGLGAEEPQELPAGQCHLAQPAGGVWRPDGAVLRHQERQEEPQL